MTPPPPGRVQKTKYVRLKHGIPRGIEQQIKINFARIGNGYLLPWCNTYQYNMR